jgi:hypothetical protein
MTALSATPRRSTLPALSTLDGVAPSVGVVRATATAPAIGARLCLVPKLNQDAFPDDVTAALVRGCWTAPLVATVPPSAARLWTLRTSTPKRTWTVRDLVVVYTVQPVRVHLRPAALADLARRPGVVAQPRQRVAELETHAALAGLRVDVVVLPRGTFVTALVAGCAPERRADTAAAATTTDAEALSPELVGVLAACAAPAPSHRPPQKRPCGR